MTFCVKIQIAVLVVINFNLSFNAARKLFWVSLLQFLLSAKGRCTEFIENFNCFNNRVSKPLFVN